MLVRVVLDDGSDDGSSVGLLIPGCENAVVFGAPLGPLNDRQVNRCCRWLDRINEYLLRLGVSHSRCRDGRLTCNIACASRGCGKGSPLS
jgi:hypothetical protein